MAFMATGVRRTRRAVLFARRVFAIAGLSGLAFLLPLYFLEERISADMPPAIAHPELYYGFVGLALAWQVLFLVIARAPSHYRTMMLPAILEKLAFGVPVVILVFQGRTAILMIGPGLLDLVFAVLFFLAFRRTPSPQEPE